MGPGLHQGAETSAGGFAIGVDVHNALHLRVIEEKAVDGAVAAVDKAGGEAAKVEALDAGFAFVFAADELY